MTPTLPRRGAPSPKKVTGKGRSNVNFQIDNQLRRELVEAAAKANRSLSAQIAWCIAYALAAEKTNERMRRRAAASRDGKLPSSFDPEVTQGPLTPELVRRFAEVDRGYVTSEELDAKVDAKLAAERDKRREAERAEIQKMVDDAMRKSVAELITPPTKKKGVA